MQNEYKAVADSYENAVFSFNDFKVGSGGGSRMTISEYHIEIPYKNEIISISNELGNHNLGKVNLTLSNSNCYNFEITSRNHFMSLFSRKKEMLNIECSNNLFKKTLQNIAISSGLEKVAKQNAFEPHITSNYTNGKWNISTKYHLEFEDKLGSLKALIDFHKLLIDSI